MIKYLAPILCCLTLSLNAFCAPKEHLFCLGQEEKLIHAKRLHSARKLVNERMISLSLQLSDGVVLNKKYLRSICNSKKPSIVMLKNILQGHQVFMNKIDPLDKVLYSLAKSNIQDIKKKATFLLLDYLSRLKSLNKDINCFKNYFPKVNKTLSNIVYIMEESSNKQILQSLGRIDKLFERIELYPLGKEKC